MRILFTGGGTGGHFFPILAVIRELKAIAEDERILDLELFYMGPDRFGEDLLKSEGVVPVCIASGKMRRYFSLANITDIFKTVIGALRGLWNMFLIMPDVVFVKGGYGALPAVLAAIIFRIPMIVHESDAVPGRVNRLAGRFAERVGLAFPDAAEFFRKEKTALVGIPIRKRILGGNRDEARERFSIYSQQPVVGIIGASQGSQKINEALLGALKELADRFEIIHQAGEANFKGVGEEASVILEFGHKERYHTAGFLDEAGMRDFYAASDLIVSRAGASSIFEIAAWGKPAVLIPLKEAAQDHQRKNAYAYAAGGAAVVLEEPNLTPHILFDQIQRIIENPEALKRMGEAAQRFARIDAAPALAREILKIGTHE